MKLNSFGETIRRIEAERLAQAQAAVEAGWTETDHPTKCCPTVEAPRRAGKTKRAIEEIERLRDQANSKADWWTEQHHKLTGQLAAFDAAQPKFDHGMLQLSMDYRRRGMARGHQLWQQVEHAKQRADHYQRLTAKYQNQINKRNTP